MVPLPELKASIRAPKLETRTTRPLALILLA
jgi:hypothetical protein